jgi:epsilon-lactone hydrolase
MASAELRAVIHRVRAHGAASATTVEERRAGFEAFMATLPLPDDVECTPVKVGDVPAEWIRAVDVRKDGAILYLHGGGFVIGSVASHRALIAALGAASAMQVLAIDYRRAPESRFPAALEDAMSAYWWLTRHRFPAHRLVLAGDSAGAGLVVAALVALRDAGVRLPAAAVCLSPWVDLECTGESLVTRAERDPMLSKELLVALAGAYLGDHTPRAPLASPLHADLQGLPPMLVQAGDADVLHDDAVRLTERARAAGVDVTLQQWPDMIHVWHLFAPMLQEGRDAIEDAGAFVRAHL